MSHGIEIGIGGGCEEEPTYDMSARLDAGNASIGSETVEQGRAGVFIHPVIEGGLESEEAGVASDDEDRRLQIWRHSDVFE